MKKSDLEKLNKIESILTNCQNTLKEIKVKAVKKNDLLAEAFLKHCNNYLKK